MRSGVDIATSQWSINSTNIDPYPLPPSEIWNQNLIAIGNANIDYGTSGVHSGCHLGVRPIGISQDMNG